MVTLPLPVTRLKRWQSHNAGEGEKHGKWAGKRSAIRNLITGNVGYNENLYMAHAL